MNTFSACIYIIANFITAQIPILLERAINFENLKIKRATVQIHNVNTAGSFLNARFIFLMTLHTFDTLDTYSAQQF